MEERRERVLAAIEPRLLSYAWPGNVRELENVMERVAVLLAAPPSQGEEPAGDGGREPIERELATVIPELFGHAPRGDGETLRTARRGSEREHVLRILAECGGNHSLAARKLGIGRTTLWRKLRVE
jgi:propionate catabolism operon transcriptional regulator